MKLSPSAFTSTPRCAAICWRMISLWMRTTSWARRSPSFSYSREESTMSENRIVTVPSSEAWAPRSRAREIAEATTASIDPASSGLRCVLRPHPNRARAPPRRARRGASAGRPTAFQFSLQAHETEGIGGLAGRSEQAPAPSRARCPPLAPTATLASSHCVCPARPPARSRRLAASAVSKWASASS